MIRSRLSSLLRHWRRTPELPAPTWEYKVVQLVAQMPEDPEQASRRLGGSLSAESLRDQFPEHYTAGNGRGQINAFLNRLGADGWELVETQQVGGLPLMFFKRRCRLPASGSGAKTGSAP